LQKKPSKGGKGPDKTHKKESRGSLLQGRRTSPGKKAVPLGHQKRKVQRERVDSPSFWEKNGDRLFGKGHEFQPLGKKKEKWKREGPRGTAWRGRGGAKAIRGASHAESQEERGEEQGDHFFQRGSTVTKKVCRAQKKKGKNGRLKGSVRALGGGKKKQTGQYHRGRKTENPNSC